MRELLKHAGGVLIGGHRGCSCDYPENSIAAMEEGIRRGADYLEIDVQLTKDGIPVVFHDTRLEQRTALTGYVHETDYGKMKEAIPGICTLHEAMEWGAVKGAWFGLELKTLALDMQPSNMELVERIWAELNRTQMRERVFVFGPDYQVLKRLRRMDEKVALGLIVPFVPSDPVGLMKEMDALVYLSYIYNMTPGIIKELHEHGFYVSGAILREDKWVKRARELGADMFETDHPEKYRRKPLTGEIPYGAIDGKSLI